MAADLSMDIQDECRVLVVEDEPAVRSLACRMLERSGFRVLPAADGMEAMDLLNGNDEVHLVLSDLEMPRMSGIRLFQALREKGMRLPFILASGYQSPSDLEDLPPEWRSDLVHLQKPWTRSDILDAIHAALDLFVPERQGSEADSPSR